MGQGIPIEVDEDTVLDGSRGKFWAFIMLTGAESTSTERTKGLKCVSLENPWEGVCSGFDELPWQKRAPP